MLDDLRDYRFYAADMIHPSPQAEDYIWEKFGDGYFQEETKILLAKWNAVLAALSHRPFHPRSDAHQQFLKETLKTLQSLQPDISVEEEIKSVQRQLL
jgi:hypothetical protein